MAKGIDHAGSDVDVLLVSSSFQLGDALALLLSLEERLGWRIEVKLYTLGEFSALREEAGSVVQRIDAGPIELLRGSLE